MSNFLHRSSIPSFLPHFNSPYHTHQSSRHTDLIHSFEMNSPSQPSSSNYHWKSGLLKVVVGFPVDPATPLTRVFFVALPFRTPAIFSPARYSVLIILWGILNVMQYNVCLSRYKITFKMLLIAKVTSVSSCWFLPTSLVANVAFTEIIV